MKSTFKEDFKYGSVWEDYVKEKFCTLHDLDDSWEVEHVSEILGPHVFRVNDNKYPDFRLTNEKLKYKIFVDAKCKKGSYFHGLLVTADRSYIKSYKNIVAMESTNGYSCEGYILFWCVQAKGAYLMPLEPDQWHHYDNEFGDEIVGQYYTKDYRHQPEFDEFQLKHVDRKKPIKA